MIIIQPLKEYIINLDVKIYNTLTDFLDKFKNPCAYNILVTKMLDIFDINLDEFINIRLIIVTLHDDINKALADKKDLCKDSFVTIQIPKENAYILSEFFNKFTNPNIYNVNINEILKIFNMTLDEFLKIQTMLNSIENDINQELINV